jgi:hypothetical protein
MVFVVRCAEKWGLGEIPVIGTGWARARGASYLAMMFIKG